MPLLASAIRLTVPILLAALGGVFSERGGVVNIALEGMMITGTFFGALGAYQHGPLAGALYGILGVPALGSFTPSSPSRSASTRSSRAWP